MFEKGVGRGYLYKIMFGLKPFFKNLLIIIVLTIIEIEVKKMFSYCRAWLKMVLRNEGLECEIKSLTKSKFWNIQYLNS